MVLLANKNDLRGAGFNEVTTEMGEKYSKDLNNWASRDIPYIETSAKSGENVHLAFKMLLKALERS